MKAYTDIEQSKKMTEILPLESVDMLFQLGEDKYADSIKVPLTKKHWKQMMPDINPCWSLAALLDVLPLEIETHKQTDGHKTYYYVESYVKRMGKEMYRATERHENLVDACYEMIIKLHERKLL